jgi:hypothetical protein
MIAPAPNEEMNRMAQIPFGKNPAKIEKELCF